MNSTQIIALKYYNASDISYNFSGLPAAVVEIQAFESVAQIIL